VLFDTGVGAFFEPKLRDRFGVVEGQHVLLDSLGSLGLGEDDIDLVVLSHLHFDHAGGLLSAWRQSEPRRLLFTQAQYLVSEGAWQRALHPMLATGRRSWLTLHRCSRARAGCLSCEMAERGEVLGPGYRCSLSDGHTPALLITEVVGRRDRVVLASDLVPGAAWVHVPVTMGYDRYPERLVDEKIALLSDAVSSRAWLCFVHDPSVAVGRVAVDERGGTSSGRRGRKSRAGRSTSDLHARKSCTLSQLSDVGRPLTLDSRLSTLDAGLRRTRSTQPIRSSMTRRAGAEPR